MGKPEIRMTNDESMLNERRCNSRAATPEYLAENQIQLLRLLPEQGGLIAAAQIGGRDHSEKVHRFF
jgi:hypothetical protein